MIWKLFEGLSFGYIARIIIFSFAISGASNIAVDSHFYYPLMATLIIFFAIGERK